MFGKATAVCIPGHLPGRVVHESKPNGLAFDSFEKAQGYARWFNNLDAFAAMRCGDDQQGAVLLAARLTQLEG